MQADRPRFKSIPIKPVLMPAKGRGAVANPQGRFEREARQVEDDGWSDAWSGIPAGPFARSSDDSSARSPGWASNGTSAASSAGTSAASSAGSSAGTFTGSSAASSSDRSSGRGKAGGPVLPSIGEQFSPAGAYVGMTIDGQRAGVAAEAGALPKLKTHVSPERAKSIISRNDSPDIRFDQSINPYRGCEHGCIYCYARPNHSYVGLSAGQDFESRLFAKTNAVAMLRKELASPSYRCSEIALGTATDAYQPIERDYRITRDLIQLLSDCQHPVSIVTKSSLIERDIDLLAPMAAKGLAYVGITVTTLDSDLARVWEPRAAAPWRRIETIRRLSEAGIPVSVFIAPIVPFINDQDLEKVMQAAVDAGAQRLHYTVLRLPHELKDVFIQWLRHHFPDREKRVMSRIEDLRGGKGRLNDSEFFTRMRGKGAWAELIKMRIGLSSRKLGLKRDRLDLRTDLFVAPSSDGQLGLF